MSAKVRYLKLVARGPYYKKNYTLAKEHTTPEFLHQFMREATALIEEGLARDGLVRLHEFGTFELQWAEARRGRNPRTGEAIIIPGKNRIVFRPANKLENLANREFAHLKPSPIVLEPKPLPAAPQPKPVSSPPPLPPRVAEILSDFAPARPDAKPSHLRFDFAEEEAAAEEAELTQLAESAFVVGSFEEEPASDEKAWSDLLSTPRKPVRPHTAEFPKRENGPALSAMTHNAPASTTTHFAPRPEPGASPLAPEKTDVHSSAGDQLTETAPTPRTQSSDIFVERMRQRQYTPKPHNGFSREPEPSRKGLKRFFWLAGVMAALLLLLFAFLKIWPGREQTSTNGTSTEIAETTAPPQPPVAEHVLPATPKPFFPGGSHQVVAGDNLWKISGRYYVDPFLWPNIYRANSTIIDNPDVLEMAQMLAVPVLHGQPNNLTPEDRRNLAQGYFLVFDYYKKTAEKHLAPFALWAAVKYDPAILETHRDQISADELAFLHAHETGRMAVR